MARGVRLPVPRQGSAAGDLPTLEGCGEGARKGLTASCRGSESCGSTPWEEKNVATDKEERLRSSRSRPSRAAASVQGRAGRQERGSGGQAARGRRRRQGRAGRQERGRGRQAARG